MVKILRGFFEPILQTDSFFFGSVGLWVLLNQNVIVNVVIFFNDI